VIDQIIYVDHRPTRCVETRFDRLMSRAATHLYVTVSRLNADHIKLMITDLKKLSFTFFNLWHFIDAGNGFFYFLKTFLYFLKTSIENLSKNFEKCETAHKLLASCTECCSCCISVCCLHALH